MINIIYWLIILVKIDQETVLRWFGVNTPDFTSTSPVSIETFKLLVEGLWERVETGLTLDDIESIIFVMLFVRFLALSIRYNLKTSFYIVCIGFFAGYLWYRHLIDILLVYRQGLVNLPYLNNLGENTFWLLETSKVSVKGENSLKDNVPWYDIGGLIYYAIKNAIIKTDSSGVSYHIDPISMAISSLKGFGRAQLSPLYYEICDSVVPIVGASISRNWKPLSKIIAYAVIVRMGKRYCPYLIRWHWTFLLVVDYIERPIIQFVFRILYFQKYVLMPQANALVGEPILLEIKTANTLMTFIIFSHIGFIFFAMFHALWGQYFYIPFLVENIELNIGPRPKNSIYSMGKTAWQDESGKHSGKMFPKLWYGFFGSGTTERETTFKSFIRFLRKIIKKVFKKKRKKKY